MTFRFYIPEHQIDEEVQSMDPGTLPRMNDLTYFSGSSSSIEEIESVATILREVMPCSHKWWDVIRQSTCLGLKTSMPSADKFSMIYDYMDREASEPDMNAIRASSRLVAIWPNGGFYSNGTWFEIGFAIAIGVPVTVISYSETLTKSGVKSGAIDALIRNPFLTQCIWAITNSPKPQDLALLAYLLHADSRDIRGITRSLKG